MKNNTRNSSSRESVTVTVTRTNDTSSNCDDVNTSDQDFDDEYGFYNISNSKDLFDQLKYNSSEKDKLIAVMSGAFIAAAAAILNFKILNTLGLVLISLVLFIFAISFACSLYAFHIAYKSTKYQYKLFCKGLNDPTKRITHSAFTKKVKKSRKKYRSNLYDMLAIRFCLSGVAVFVVLIICLAFNLFRW